MSKTQMAEMSWYEFRDAMAMNDLVILPVGAMEAHGLHAPLGTDTILAEDLARRIGEKAGVPVAPVIPFGASRDMAAFPGTLTMDPDLLRRLIVQICESWFDHGAKRFLILNGNAENSTSVHMACCDLHENHENVIAVQSEWWHTVPALTGLACDDHGGKYETSILLALDKTLCDMRLADTKPCKKLGEAFDEGAPLRFQGGIVPCAGGMPMSALTENGSWGTPAQQADPAIGAQMTDAYVDYCVQLVHELKSVYL